jgi:hypothetical protein
MSEATEVRVFLNVYGVVAEIDSSVAAVAEEIAEDFAHFRVRTAEGPVSLRVRLHPEPPPYGLVPAREATVYTPRNVSFEDEGVTYIDYSGRALGTYRAASGELDVYSVDRDLLYEVAYLFLLSQLGERLDERALHRVHALGVAVDGCAALVLLPMGGGKSTLAAHLLRHREVQLLSDDSPMLARHGSLWAFPLRIGILPGSESGFAPEQLRTIQRMEFGPKLLVRYENFRERIVGDAVPGVVFLGRRSLAEGCSIRPATRLRALMALIPNCVIGLGLFQGMEFVFHRGGGEFLEKIRVAFSRLLNCIALVRRSRAAVVVLGRDSEANAAAVLAFLRETCAKPRE